MDKENLSLSRHFLCGEFFGTMILALGVSGSFSFDKDEKQNFNFFVLLIVLFTAITMFACTGDADFNPGVTLMKYLTYTDKKKHLVSVFMTRYFTMQILGAVVGFILSYYLRDGFAYKLMINPNISQANALVIEIFCTCVLYLIILIEDDSSNNAANSTVMKFVIVIAGVAAGEALGANISGAGMNPAIGIAANITRFFITGKLEEVKYLWIYIIGPFVASYLTSWFYVNVYKNKKYYLNENNKLFL